MKGLTSKQAQTLLAQHGPNALQQEQTSHWWKILFSQFRDVFVLILLVAAGISFALEEAVDGTVILVIVLLNAAIGFFQEFRVEKTLEALKKMIHPEIRVVRDGKEVKLSTELLVPGDLVVLGEGDRVPADGIVQESHGMKIDESAFTGESLALEKDEEAEVFMGTLVVRGGGMFEVTTTGMATQFGAIARMTTQTKAAKSPLQKELEHMGWFVTKVTLIICALLFLVGRWRDFSIFDSLLFSVSVAIAAVPEGLPTTITIALALGASVLARKKAIIKKLSSVETLGAVTTICSDKTGTLTKNEMTVREVYLADRSIFSVSGVGYDPHSGRIDFMGHGGDAQKENLVLCEKLLRVCRLCNEAKLEKKGHQYTVLGDPTEGALLTLSEKKREGKTVWTKEKVKEFFPFDSVRKMMSVWVGKEVLVKGSPDQVLEHCQFWSDGKTTHPLTPERKKIIQRHYERMAEKAYRVLAFAQRNTHSSQGPQTAADAEKNLTFLGLVGMIDPPRSEVRNAIDLCHTAGIRTIVITGDFGITAEAVARELGMIRECEAIVLTGTQVTNMTDTELKKILRDREQPVIFARSLPEQKMRIVDLLQSEGEVVAMTGDGVNDAPALKKADIGVAMGITGTEVSKEAATMILTDDSFSSIVTAVEEGRRIYENLKKFVWFIFSCNIGELTVIFAAIIFQYPLPLTAILILCIDLGTDILPAIALGVDEAEDHIMQRPPRDPKKRLLNKNFVQYFLGIGLVIGASVTGAFLYTLMGDGWTFDQGLNVEVTHAVTVAFVSLVFVQLLNAFSARSNRTSIFRQNIFSNHFLILALMSSVLMTLLMVYVPWMNMILKTTPLNAADWGVVAIASVIPLIVVELRKALPKS